MAQLETIWPEQMHSAPTPTAYATMLLCGTYPLTSPAAMVLSGLSRYAYANDSFNFEHKLSDVFDMADKVGLEVDFVFKPIVDKSTS